MNREERERMVDRLLNEALAPQDAEPRAGLEERILTNLRTQPERRPWWRWMWVPAAVAAAVLLVISLRPIRLAQPTRVPVAAQRQPAPAVVSPVSKPPIVATVGKPVRKRPAPTTVMVSKATPIAPRQPVFAPARLSEAERALVAVLQSKPSEAQALVQQQEQTRQEAAEFMEQAMAPRR